MSEKDYNRNNIDTVNSLIKENAVLKDKLAKQEKNIINTLEGSEKLFEENAELKKKRTELEDETSDLSMQIINLRDEINVLKEQVEELKYKRGSE